jgi:NAD(P)-dependent dehydrogenase (short-subunit alcohol dehydrogenase family)
MQNQVCVITGATSGIGKATAIGLARMGGNVVIIGRDKMQGENALSEIKTESGNSKVDLLLADLSSQAEVRKLAEEIKARYTSLHMLINNAGIAPVKRSVPRTVSRASLPSTTWPRSCSLISCSACSRTVRRRAW